MHLGTLLTAMVTPFKDDLSVDYDISKKLAAYLVENGSEGIVVAGTTGESPTLSSEEKINLFKVIKEAVGDEATVIAGTGSNSTQSSIELTKEAEKIGVDAVMLVAPYYNKPPQRGLYEHFKAVAENTNLPVIIYNVPSRCSVDISAETTIALSDVKNIIGVKEASGNMEKISEIILKTPNDFLVYSGDDSATYPVMTLGGDGVISVASHLVGNQMSQMLENCQKGAWDKALAMHNRLMPVFNGLFETTSPILVKAALQEKGINVGSLRLPLIEATKDERKKIIEIIESV